MANVATSVGDTPKSSADISCVINTPATVPMAIPASASFNPLITISLTMSALLAPSAMRTPISGTCCATK